MGQICKTPYLDNDTTPTPRAPQESFRLPTNLILPSLSPPVPQPDPKYTLGAKASQRAVYGLPRGCCGILGRHKGRRGSHMYARGSLRGHGESNVKEYVKANLRVCFFTLLRVPKSLQYNKIRLGLPTPPKSPIKSSSSLYRDLLIHRVSSGILK